MFFEFEGASWSCLFAAKSSVFSDVYVRYLSNALDFHRLIFLMSSVGMPAATAEFAAPLRKE